MNLYIALLIVAVILGAVPGYIFRKSRYQDLWSFADLAWVCAAMFSAFFAIAGLNKLSTASDRAFAVEKLTFDRNHILLASYSLERTACSSTGTAKSISKDQPSFCETLRQVRFFSSLPKFNDLDATRLAKQFESYQSRYFPDGSFNVLGALHEYGRFYALRKDLLETNPYQDIVEATDRVTKWLVALGVLLMLRSGRTYAEVFRRRWPD